MRLLDTNVLSEILRVRPNPAVTAQLRQRQSHEVFASAVTRYELRYGAGLRQDAAQFWLRLQQEVMPMVTWLPVTQAIAERGGVIAGKLRGKGRACGDLDPLLAATALDHQLVLVTRNLRHFEQIEDLRIENWFDDPSA